uniref:Uncharacterized protein n=1 Tax=Candidatus Kentrum sp. SD TaxID=2126332 RepID=A0A451BJG1_9GAMM|nr:MAG: hypothetical protein BECKSD772F_GA0070984_10474 [Candidatus Kentron sp. SD]VFK47308.1 MAG: hypothetical protein BECKSD772E_GA0070983_10924 [Candidatus Kentron sp. SD]VFK78424.1 MAG: hypothetical protein BECKSD772D_GA0070982_101429 [Candidatus Kentron sp. SD]
MNPNGLRWAMSFYWLARSNKLQTVGLYAGGINMSWISRDCNTGFQYFASQSSQVGTKIPSSVKNAVIPISGSLSCQSRQLHQAGMELFRHFRLHGLPQSCHLGFMVLSQGLVFHLSQGRRALFGSLFHFFRERRDQSG